VRHELAEERPDRRGRRIVMGLVDKGGADVARPVRCPERMQRALVDA
jgi:hypothetical protein